MEVESNVTPSGSLRISTEVVAKIARLAALEISGVAQVTVGPQGIRSLSKKGPQKPVTVAIQDGVAEITLQIYAEYGCVVQQVCAKVQENVKTTIQNMTGITVSKVNVVVAGLQEPAADE